MTTEASTTASASVTVVTDDRLGLEARREAVGKPFLPSATALRETFEEVFCLLLALRMADEGLEYLGVQRPPVPARRRAKCLQRLRRDISNVDVRHAFDDIALIAQIRHLRKMSATGSARKNSPGLTGNHEAEGIPPPRYLPIDEEKWPSRCRPIVRRVALSRGFRLEEVVELARAELDESKPTYESEGAVG